MPGGRPSLLGPWTETTRLPGPWGPRVLLLWKFRKQVDGRICSWQFRTDWISSRHFSVLLQWSTDYLCIKIQIVGEGEREEGWAVDYFSLLGIPQIFLKSSCA